MEESLKLGKLNPVLFCVNWENNYFSLIERHIGPVFISKEFKHKNNYLLILSALVFCSFPINY